MSPTDKINKISKVIAIDPSANHLSYTVAQIDPDNNKFIITAVGMIWTKTSWTKGKRFSYMYKALSHIIREERPDTLYTEAFFTNSKNENGKSSSPSNKWNVRDDMS